MTTTDPTPASMGGPLSEADRLAEIRAQLDACDRGPNGQIGLSAEMFVTAGSALEFLLGKVDALLAHNGVLVTEVYFQAQRADESRARVGVLEGQLATARNLPEIEIGPHWNAQSEAEASGRNATLREVRRILDGGDPPRPGRSRTEVLDDFNRSLRTLRALDDSNDEESFDA